MDEPAPKLYTIVDSELLEDRDQQRYELWQGQPYAMTGTTPAHNIIALALRDVLKPQVNPCRVFAADVAVKLGADVYSDKSYPDVMAVCNPNNERVQTAPVLLAEVYAEVTELGFLR